MKFRAWDKKDKRMIIDTQKFIPLIVTNKGVLRLSPMHEGYFYTVCEGDFELMASTGLKDKNDIEIFEGDIVQYSSSSEDGIGEVKKIHDTNNLAFWWISQNTTSPSMYGQVDYFGCAKELEIFGNIHENPELIK